MIYRLFITLFLACTGATLGAQCVYADLLQQGRSLYAKGQYRDALKKYAAARICDATKSAEVDQEVVKVFDAVEKEKKDAQDAKAALEKESLATEAQRKAAEQERDNAQTARDNAEASAKRALEKTQEADTERAAAQTALEEADKYLQIIEGIGPETVDALVGQANKLIYRLAYDSATAKLHTAAYFNQPTASFKKVVAELAFYWNETGQTARATTLLTDAKQTAVPGEPAALRSWLKNYAGSWYDSLMLRYYRDMAPIPAGQAAFKKDKPQVERFEIARTETTVWQYALYLAAQGKSIRDDKIFSTLPWGLNGDNPVVLVSWIEAARYTNWLSRQFRLDTVYTFEGKNITTNVSAKGYRLPTELEWEYAARGGPAHEDFKYAGGNAIDSVGWHFWISGKRTQPVAAKMVNSLGLYDMTGNAREWCSDPDVYDAFRVLRGGSWYDPPVFMKTFQGDSEKSEHRDNYTGFRLARSQ